MTMIARTFTFTWLITAALIPAKNGAAGQTETSQGEKMRITQPNIPEPRGLPLSHQGQHAAPCSSSHRHTSAPHCRRASALVNTEFVGRLPVGRSSGPSRDGCEHKISIRPMGGGFRGTFSRFFCGIQSVCSEFRPKVTRFRHASRAEPSGQPD